MHRVQTHTAWLKYFFKALYGVLLRASSASVRACASFCKYCSICNKNHLKSQFEPEKLHAECVLHHRNILTSRTTTPFALADS